MRCCDCGGPSRGPLCPLCPLCSKVAEALGHEADARLRMLGVIPLGSDS